MTTTQKTENKDKEVKKPREQFTAYKGRIPYLNCTWWETITFGWCKPFIDQTQDEKNYVKQDEFGDEDPAYRIKPAYEKLVNEWEKQVQSNPESKYKLIKASVFAFKYDMIINLIASLIGTFRGIIKPLIFERMITNVVNNGDKMYSIQLAFLLFAIQIFFSMTMDQHYSMHMHQKGDLMCEALKSMIFEKQLKVTSSSNKKYNSAKVNDLIHDKSNKIRDIFHRAPRFFCLPVNFIFSTFYLYYHMGNAFIGGFILFTISIYMNYKIDNQRREMWKSCHRNYEKRITLVEELIENIKTLKLNSWTNIWRDQVREARLYEHDQWYKMNLKNKAIDLITGNVSNALRIVVYTTFFATGNRIGLGEALSVESTLGMFEGSIREIPSLLDFQRNLNEAFEKIQDYFEVPESNESFIERIVPQIAENENAVKIVDGNFHWGMTVQTDELEEDKKERLEKEAEKEKEKKEKKQKKAKQTKKDDKEVTTNSASETTAAESSDDSSESKKSEKKEKKEQTLLDFTTLKGVNVTIKKGEFVTIIGDVASGKSSFLHALVGDMLSLDQEFVDDLGEKVLDEDLKKKVKEHSLQQSSSKQIEINGSISYTHQTPWILNKSVRDNILFGSEMDEERYNQTINCCQMARDLEQMDDSDLTEIGERGINLSGGQKARVGLARAVYSNKDIILMDDPVSALDAQVKKAVFKEVIMGVLKDKTRILATHAIDFLDVCDSIICLDKGNVVFQGHYNEVKDNEYMKKLLDIHQSHKKLQEEAAKKAAEKKAKIEAEQKLFGGDKEEKKEEQETKKEEEKEEKKKDEKPKPFKVDLTKSFDMAKKLIRDEQEEEEKIDRGFWEIFKDYLSYSGGYKALFVYFVILAVQAVVPIFNTMQFGEWVMAEDSYENVWYYSIKYTAFALGSMLLGMTWGIATDYFNYDSQMNLFKDILMSVCAAPINLYFDVTPTGRVYERVNHASGHINWLPHMMGHGFRTFAAMITTIGLAFYEVPRIFVLIIPGIYMIRKAQTSVGISQHRLGHIRHHLSMPAWTHQSETQHGISTIRAYNQLHNQMGISFGLKQNSLSITVFCHGLHRYKEIRILIISQLIIFAITCACIMENSGLAAAALLMPMLISRCEGLTHQIGGFMWFFNDFEDHMKHMEKSFMVRSIKPEKFDGTVKKEDLETKTEESEEVAQWPAKGGIEFKDVELRYRPDKELVLKKLSFKIQPGEKVGVIGRTGAGKSTVCLALSRIVEIDSGKITIDGQDTRDLDLDHLRSCITVIPQDPVLFSGSLRKNLDPLSEFTDDKLEGVLRRAKMGHLIDNNEEGLETEMKEIGELSSGEKQIICICRAILKKNKICVLDEATANIDVVTEQKIQDLIKTEFADSTMITVAHRLNTIIQSDKILVLGHGKTIEMGSPDDLISQADSTFNKYLLDLKNGDADDFM